MSKKKLKDCKILVTPTSFAKYNRSLAEYLEKNVAKIQYNKTGKPLKEKDLIPIIGEFDGMIAGLDEISAKVIESAKNLKVISRYGVGVEKVDLEAAKKFKITVTNTPGANSVSVAELTIGLIFAACRNIVFGNNDTKNGGWPRLAGMTLFGKTIGIVGLGSIGKEVAVRLSSFNTRILAYDVYQDGEFASKYKIEYTGLENLFKESDIVSLHAPVNEETKSIINKESLSTMKKGSILINTSRGELVDEDALYESLASSHIRAAALDAFIKEPPGRKNKLLSLDEVIATPHMGAATDNASDEMTRISIDECLSVLKGLTPKYAVV
jgi:D-3-phosphoglycerate dehydrogenase